MHLKRILIGMIFLLISCTANVYACQCRERQPPCAQYWEADAVFVGSVVKIKSADESQSFGKANEDGTFERVHFNLEKAYRGVGGESVELREYMSSCRFGFEEGKRDLVYAYSDPSTKTLSTHTCSRTTELSDASEDLQYINSLSKETPDEAIKGLLVDEEKTLKGIRVMAEGMGRRYRSVSDEKGWFSLTVAEPGEYKVRIFLPRDVGVGGTEDLLEKISGTLKTKRHYVLEYKVEVKAGRCAFIDVPLLI